MSNYSPDPRIEAYLTGQLSSQERRHFESQLTTDPALQREVLRAQSNEQMLEEASRRRLRQLLNVIRAEVDSPEPPRQTGRNPIQTAFGKRWWLGLVTAALLAGGWYFWSQRTCPTLALVDTYALEPVLVHEEAETNVSELAFRASAYYAAAAHDDLNKLTTESRNIASLYYLAHDYLRLDDYSRAESTFDRLLAQAEELTAYAEYQELDRLRFNRLLSQFGMDNDPATTLKALEELLAEPDLAETEIGTRAQALAVELENPWRWWACR